MQSKIFEFTLAELPNQWGPLPPSKRKLTGKVWIEALPSSLKLLDQLPKRGLGIVGTRNPQFKTINHMEKVFKELRNSNLIIVSGMARGVDSKAHELALDIGLKTIAILGCGLHHCYPQSNRTLRKEIVRNGGLIISEYESDVPPYPDNFLNRNRWIPYLSEAVWVAEAGAYSGSINTAQHTHSQGKHLLVTPSFPGDPFFEGNDRIFLTPRTQAMVNVQSLNTVWIDEFKIDPKSETTTKLNWPKSIITDAILAISSKHSVWPVHVFTEQLPDMEIADIYKALSLYQEGNFIESTRPGWYQLKEQKLITALRSNFD